MQRTTNTSSNGRQPAVLDPQEVSTPIELDSISAKEATIAPPPVPPETEAATPTKEPRKKPVKLILVGVGVGAIVAGAFGYHWWQFAAAHEETDNATVTGQIHPVSARIPGTVDQVLVNDNQTVQKGQLLVKLDPRDYQLKLQQAQADLAAAQQKASTAQVNIALSFKNAEAATTQSSGDIAKAQAAIAQAQAQVTESQAGIPRAQAQLAASDANLDKARTDYDRFNLLYSQGAVAQRELDTARQAFQVAQAQRNADTEQVAQAQSKLAQTQQTVETAQAGLTSSQGGLQQAEAKGIQTEVSRSDLGTAQAAIAQAQAALKNAQQQLSYTTLTAPVEGRVGRKNVEVGQQIQAGTPLMAIVSNEYWVTANFKETQLEKMRPGQTAEVKLDSFPHKIFTGRVESFSPASGAQFALLPPDNATGNFTKVVQRIPVKVVLDPDSIRGYESVITPGMSATVTVELK